MLNISRLLKLNGIWDMLAKEVECGAFEKNENGSHFYSRNWKICLARKAD